MLSNKSLILISLLIAASALSAWSITDTYFGNPYGTLDARIYALGGAGMFNQFGPFGIADNPANLTLMKKTLGVAVNTYIDRNEDDRAIPLYNSFDNYVDDAVISSNVNFFDRHAVAVGASYLGIGVGAYYKPYLSFDGDYKEEVRNNRNTDNDGFPEKLAMNSIESEGTLYKTGFLASFNFNPQGEHPWNLGVDVAQLKGSIEREKTIRWTNWAVQQVGTSVKLPDYTDTEKYDLSGQQWKVGGAFQLSSRLGIGATFTPKTVLDKTGSLYHNRGAYLNHGVDSTNVVIDENYTLPTDLRVGLSYMPRNVMHTVFNLDLEYVLNSQISELYDNTLNLYAGVEHHITNRIPFRMGFNAVNSYFFTTEATVDNDNNPVTVYYAKKVLTPMFTAGSSVKLMENLTADLGFGYSWREYEAVDLFGDAYYDDRQYTGSTSYVLWPNSHISLANRGWENPDKVRENNISLNAGLSFTW